MKLGKENPNIPPELRKGHTVSLPGGKGKAKILSIITGTDGIPTYLRTTKGGVPMNWIRHIKDTGRDKSVRNEKVDHEIGQGVLEVHSDVLGLPVILLPQTVQQLTPAGIARAKIRHLLPEIFDRYIAV